MTEARCFARWEKDVWRGIIRHPGAMTRYKDLLKDT